MSPDSTDADPKSLPRSFRGYNRHATEELFRRVAWDYGVLAGEHRKLKQALEELRPQPTPARRKGDLDGEAHLLFAAAQRAVRELRESTRAECELALKKAKARAAELEQEATRAAADSVAVLNAAAALRATLRASLDKLEHGERLPSTAPVEPAVTPVADPANGALVDDEPS